MFSFFKTRKTKIFIGELTPISKHSKQRLFFYYLIVFLISLCFHVRLFLSLMQCLDTALKSLVGSISMRLYSFLLIPLNLVLYVLYLSFTLNTAALTLVFPLSVHGFLWVQWQNGSCDEEGVHLQVRNVFILICHIAETQQRVIHKLIEALCL